MLPFIFMMMQSCTLQSMERGTLHAFTQLKEPTYGYINVKGMPVMVPKSGGEYRIEVRGLVSGRLYTATIDSSRSLHEGAVFRIDNYDECETHITPYQGDPRHK